MTELSSSGMPGEAWPPPAPGPAPRPKVVAAQAGLELRTLVRNGEQLLLTLIIPVLLLVVFSAEALISVGHVRRIDFVAPGILALAIMSTSFTSLAIGTAFERRYGVLKRLGATPLGRSGLIAAKGATVLAVEAGQVVLILLGIGGIIYPLTKIPPGLRPVLRLLPSGALSHGLRSVLTYGAGLSARDALVLAAWAVAGVAAATRWFRWE